MTTEKYAFEKDKLIIFDPELNLHIDKKFKPLRITPEDLIHRKEVEGSNLEVVEGPKGEILQACWKKGKKMHGECQYYYPGGSIRFFSFYSEGKLHGPSTFLSEDGTLLASAWFVAGKQEGKSWQYYKSGILYSRLRYLDGAYQGMQEYYYPDGSPKSIIPYFKGQLHGKVILYDAHGKVERELVFNHGKKA